MQGRDDEVLRYETTPPRARDSCARRISKNGLYFCPGLTLRPEGDKNYSIFVQPRFSLFFRPHKACGMYVVPLCLSAGRGHEKRVAQRMDMGPRASRWG